MKYVVFCTQELPRSVNTATLSGAGVMRLFNKVGETVNKITYRMDESDPVRIQKGSSQMRALAY